MKELAMDVLRLRRRWTDMSLCHLLLAMLAASGCTTLHQSPWTGHVAKHPEQCSNVSVIFVEATPDVGNWGKLDKLSDRFHRCGIRTCYFDPSVHGDPSVLASWIEHEKSRGQRVVVVGWSYGVVETLDALKLLEPRQISVDTIVCIDCFWLNWHRGDDLQPSNADRVVLIYRDQSRLPEGFHNPVVHRIDTYRHLTVPGHRHTVDVLFQETVRLGSGVQANAASSSTEQLAINDGPAPNPHPVR